MKKLFLIILCLFQIEVLAQQKLLLVGGGDRPPEALKAWVALETPATAQVMIITWASASKKQDYENSISRDLKAVGVNTFFTSQNITPENKEQFLQDLKQSTHIFFSGGNQQLIMDVVQDPDIMQALQQAYWVEAKPVAGTSAGTAVQAEMMIMGDEAPLQKGLGFLPKSVTDQHFFLRQREARLRKYMNLVPADFVGFGVDEDGSILFQKDSRTGKFKGTVLGDKNVLFIGPAVNNVREEKVLTPNSCQSLFKN